MNFKHNPFFVIISSPSGAGKSTICKKILQADKGIKMSISTTTRCKRKQENEGKDYHFVNKEKFFNMQKNNEFIESAKVFNNYYGTSKESITNYINNGYDVLFDIDGQGKRQLLESCSIQKELNHIKIVTIFILPPSYDELLYRLKKRAQDDYSIITNRMNLAKQELLYCCEEPKYDYVIVNDNLETAVQNIKSIIQAFRIKRQIYKNISYFIEKITNQNSDTKN